MRHEFVEGAIAPRARRVGKAPGAAALIALCRRPLRSPACRAGTQARAIALTAVTTAAQQHLGPATGAQEHPACLGHRRSGTSQSACWTPPPSGAILNTSLDCPRDTRVGRDDGSYCQVEAVAALVSSALPLSGATLATAILLAFTSLPQWSFYDDTGCSSIGISPQYFRRCSTGRGSALRALKPNREVPNPRQRQPALIAPSRSSRKTLISLPGK